MPKGFDKGALGAERIGWWDCGTASKKKRPRCVTPRPSLLNSRMPGENSHQQEKNPEMVRQVLGLKW